MFYQCKIDLILSSSRVRVSVSWYYWMNVYCSFCSQQKKKKKKKWDEKIDLNFTKKKKIRENTLKWSLNNPLLMFHNQLGALLPMVELRKDHQGLVESSNLDLRYYYTHVERLKHHQDVLVVPDNLESQTKIKRAQ